MPDGKRERPGIANDENEMSIGKCLCPEWPMVDHGVIIQSGMSRLFADARIHVSQYGAAHDARWDNERPGDHRATFADRSSRICYSR